MNDEQKELVVIEFFNNMTPPQFLKWLADYCSNVADDNGGALPPSWYGLVSQRLADLAEELK